MNSLLVLRRMVLGTVLGLLALASVPVVRAELPSSAPAAAPIAALYETRIVAKEKGAKPQTTRWYFMREAGRVEVRDEHGHTGELWERDPSGKVFHSRLFHDDRAQIEYGPTEFQVLGKTWGRVSTLIDRNALGSTLKRIGQGHRAGRLVERFRGTAEGRPVDVSWDSALALPAEIHGEDAQKTTTVRLLRTWASGQAPLAMTAAETLAGYRQVDGADLGDMESDPLVMRVLQQTGQDHRH
ncbi:MAG: hypothetical protein WBP72_00745 [Rhodocyclaceae bacterium]